MDVIRRWNESVCGVSTFDTNDFAMRASCCSAVPSDRVSDPDGDIIAHLLNDGLEQLLLAAEVRVDRAL